MSGGRLREAAIVQVVLEGVPLPARKRELIDYARRQSPPGQVLAALERIPDREYALLDEVGEAIAEAQPKTGPRPAHEPKPESGEVPGGPAYLAAGAEPEAMRQDTSPPGGQRRESERAPVGTASD